MGTKKIYLVRHGQTDYNKAGIVQGCTIDASLNELGQAQSEAFWKAFKDVPFEKIYTSSLKRSIESVQKFIDTGIKWEKCAGLNEISWGKYDGKKITENDHYFQTVAEWTKGNTSMKIEGGESPEDVRKRQIPVIKQIEESEEEIILICMHGRAMRILCAGFIDGDLTKMDNYQHKNLGLYILEMNNGKLSILESNIIEHLGELSC